MVVPGREPRGAEKRRRTGGAVRAMHSEASATASGKYVKDLGRLRLSGTITGSPAASDTAPPVDPLNT